MKKALIINAHQFYEGFSPGELCRSMTRLLTEEMQGHGYEVRLTDIEQGYDKNEEVEKHVWADVIILQSPVFWFGAPWIHKKYIDEVFTAGLQQQALLVDDGRSRTDPGKHYGTGGKLQGKRYMLSLTWNAPREAFDDERQYLFAGKAVDDVFLGNTTNYRFCGAEILPPFSCFDVRKQPMIAQDIDRLRAHLKTFI